MRFKSAVVLLLIVVIGTTTFPVTGQEEPLPAIQAKGSLAPLTPSIVLPSELANVALPPQTLESAARANDFITFDALYREAMRNGQSAAAFSTLYQLWTYGVTDPVGAFYDGDIYESLARAYPGYASYIAQYRIVDSNGHVFYPTSETRAFLLERALEGNAPNVQLADIAHTTKRVELRESTEGSIWSGRTATTTARTAPRRSTTTARRERTSSTRRSSSPKPRTHSTPAVATASTPAPTKPAVAKATEKAPVVAEKKSPAVVESSPKQPAVSESTTPTTTTAATTSAEAPVVVRPEPVTTPSVADAPPVTPPQPIAADDNRFGGRGILLLVIGLVGVGLLAMMLRAPREVPTSIMPTPSNGPGGDKGPGEKASGPVPVEPLRRPSAAPPPPPPPPEKNRAGGSHG